MSSPFVGEIRLVGFNFAPTGWAFCDGQLLPISQNTALFSLLGTNFGGNGTSNFALPNLQGASPMFWGQGAGLTDRSIGESGGEPAVALLASQMPTHSHTPHGAAVAAGTSNPAGNVWAQTRGNLYSDQTPNTPMAANAIGQAGQSQPHNNMPPYLALNFVIALQGIYPSRS